MKQKTQLMVAVGLAIIGLLVVLTSLSGLAIAADQCAAPGGAGGCHPTIQTAINAAGSNDTVRVMAGTYNENVVINKNVTLLGGFDDTTLTTRTPRSSIIDGGGNDSVIKIENGAVVTIDGFTINGGDATVSGGGGGGIAIRQASAVIRDNLIENNVASSAPAIFGAGGGISDSGENTTVTIDGNTIQNNIGNEAGGNGAGGGIDLYKIAAATVTNNTVTQNTAAISGTYGTGGGISVAQVQVLTLTGNLVMNNTALMTSTGQDIRGEGGGVRIDGFNVTNDTATVENNHLIGNMAAGTMTTSGPGSLGHAEGGGLLIRSISTTLVIRNDVRGNVAVENMSLSGSGGWGGRSSGGGMHLASNDTVTLSDNEVRDNISTMQQTVVEVNSGSEGGGIALASVTGATVSDNTISGNTAVIAASLASDTGQNYFGGGGGISANCWDTPNCNLSFTRNDILNNTTAFTITLSGSDANGGANGGGIRISQGTALLQSNVISGNTANLNGDDASGGGGAGGAIDVDESTVVMNQNRVLGNRTTTQTGSDSPATSVRKGTLTSSNDVFARNTGGIECSTPDSPAKMTIINDTLYDNGESGIKVNDMASTVWVTNTIVSGHNNGLKLGNPASTLAGDYNLLNNTNNVIGGATSGPNDILNQDPLFVNAAADDFHLNSNSPAIDKGNDAVAPAVDFENDQRPFDGDFDGTARVDIGADEFGKVVYLPILFKNF